MPSQNKEAQNLRDLFNGLVPHGTSGSVKELLQSAKENDLSEEHSLLHSNAEVAETLGVIAKKDISELSTFECEKLESVIHRFLRPAIVVTNEKVGKVPWPWNSILTGEKLTKLEQSLPSVGRIDLVREAGLEIIGTAYVVGNGMLMTNRHVAVVFKAFRGQKVALEFQQCLGIDFKGETNSNSTARFPIREIVYMHHKWDLAILRFEISKNAVKPLVLAGELRSLERNVAAIGFPVFDDRVPPQIQNEIFSVFGVKRVLPGKITGRATDPVQGKLSSLLHDCSTLGGNSGSALFDLDSGLVVGLHFAGQYLQSNFAVPLFELSNEQELKSLGVCFAQPESGSPENVLVSKSPTDTGSTKISIAMTKETIISKQPTNTLIASTGKMPDREFNRNGEAEEVNKKPSWKTTFFKFMDTVIARMQRACSFGIRDSELQEAVWYIEAKFNDGLKCGSGVVIRRIKDEHQRNFLITCRHVVSDEKGKIASDILCWPHGSGYNPESTDPKRIWSACPLSLQKHDEGSGHATDGFLDWIVLEVKSADRSFDAMPFKCIKRAPKTLRDLRLIGFPSGASTMSENVVIASVSRDFRLSETISKPGVLAFKGSESATGGNSGGPFLNSSNEIVAIHRSKIGEIQYAVKANVIDEALKQQEWDPVIHDTRNLDLWIYRWIFLAILIGVPCVLWSSQRPIEIELAAIEKEPLVRRVDLDSSKFRIVSTPSNTEAIIERGVLRYKSQSFDVLDATNDLSSPYVKKDQLGFRSSWCFVIPSPSSPLTIRVHKHIEFASIDEFRKWVKNIQADHVRLIKDPYSCPAISVFITSLDLQDVDSITQNQHQIEVVMKRKGDLPKMQLRLLQDLPPVFTSYEFNKASSGVKFWLPLMFLSPESILEDDGLYLYFIPAAKAMEVDGV
jgi:S1-C subfamily serine protease